jgi:hypothetical protein
MCLHEHGITGFPVIRDFSSIRQTQKSPDKNEDFSLSFLAQKYNPSDSLESGKLKTNA